MPSRLEPALQRPNEQYFSRHFLAELRVRNMRAPADAAVAREL